AVAGIVEDEDRCAEIDAEVLHAGGATMQIAGVAGAVEDRRSAIGLRIPASVDLRLAGGRQLDVSPAITGLFVPGVVGPRMINETLFERGAACEANEGKKRKGSHHEASVRYPGRHSRSEARMP